MIKCLGLKKENEFTLDMLVLILLRHEEETKDIIEKYNENHRTGNLNLGDEKFMQRMDISKTKQKYENEI